MDIKGFFAKNWIHFVLAVVGLIIIAVYFKPQLEGYSVKQHDIEQWRGMSNETDMFREETGQEPKWTNAAFGGMPTEQISMIYPGNWFKAIMNYYFKAFPVPIGSIFLHFLSFLIFAALVRIKPLIGFLGALAFAFASYELIVIQAGHLTKSNAAAFLPAILGAMIYAYRNRNLLGVTLFGLFMTLEITMNHLQITYYFGFVMVILGFYFLYEAIKSKQIKSFLITTGGLLAAMILAVVINSGNIILTNDYAKSTIRAKNDVTIDPSGEAAKNQSGGLDRDYITNWSYGIGETFTLLSPYVKGGASETLGGSPFAEKIENSDLTPEQMQTVSNNFYAYWGEQPITSGPVYLGVIVCFLAFLSLFVVKDRIKWALLAITILAILLSWGKNFMGLTDFFIDHIPGYNKFRAVTIILVIVELTIPVMGVLALNELVKNRAEILQKQKQVLIAMGGFILFLMVVAFVGLRDNYTNSNEQRQMSAYMDPYAMRDRIMSMSDEEAAQQGIDKSNPQQVMEIVQMQIDKVMKDWNGAKEIRRSIFVSSMVRSIVFSLFFAGLIFVFFKMKDEKLAGTILMVGSIILVFVDLLPVSYNYLGSQESDNGYKYWVEKGLAKYPILANNADYQIMEQELATNPSLAAKVRKYEAIGEEKANESDYSGIARKNLINAYKFYGLNKNTNYRVFDLGGGFSSSRTSFFHKSLGGYHGAKLRNIDNLFDFHISKMNNAIFDMLNVKYFIQRGQDGNEVAMPNTTALGAAWLVKSVDSYANPNEEIRALGRQFDIENKGNGNILVNGVAEANAHVYGTERLQYVIPGKDTINLQMPNGLRTGMDAMMVMDVNGNTNYVPMSTMSLDTAKSFTPLVYMKVTKAFEPKNTAIMLDTYASKVGKKSFTGEGSISWESYEPNKLVYSANVKGDQLAVFSEIYYPIGWKATIDGKDAEILKVDYLLRGLKIPDGKHEIVFTYDLPKYHTLNTLAMVGSIVLLLLIGFGIYRQVGAGTKKESKE